MDAATIASINMLALQLQSLLLSSETPTTKTTVVTLATPQTTTTEEKDPEDRLAALMKHYPQCTFVIALPKAN